jgi:protein-S-isoprenylcysteine O-methyltransferase Ste14
MTLKYGSLFALIIAVFGIVYLIKQEHIFSINPVAIGIQIVAVGLMIWSRITFGLRSFHAAANTTEGELVTKGPYSVLRHPIYASLIYFFLSCVISYPVIETIAAVGLITTGLFARMLIEEHFLLANYPEYAGYKKRTKRVIPFIF